MKILNSKKTADHFNKKWWNEKKIMLRYTSITADILKMLNNNFKNIKTSAIATNRAYLTCKYICDNYKKNSKVLDMGCGLGFVSNVLAKKNFIVTGFDISKEAIKIAKKSSMENNIKKKPFFYVDNDNMLKKIKSNSIDVAFGLGFVRYLTKDKERNFYKQIKRILKKNGTLIVDQQNDLYELFALNSDTIKFWSKEINLYSKNKIKEKKIYDILKNKIKLPKRERASHSISAKMDVITENPLTYEKKLKKLGFKLEKILYPYCDLFPPLIQSKLKQHKINNIQKKVCLENKNDWRSMFMCFMFLNIIKKLK